MNKKYSLLDSVIGFLYKNWFLIPVAICLYGMSASYQASQVALGINFLLWFVAGGIMHRNLRVKDREIEEKDESIEELSKIIKH